MVFSLWFLSFLCLSKAIFDNEHTDWVEVGAPILSFIFGLMSLVLYVACKKNGWT